MYSKYLFLNVWPILKFWTPCVHLRETWVWVVLLGMILCLRGDRSLTTPRSGQMGQSEHLTSILTFSQSCFFKKSHPALPSQNKSQQDRILMLDSVCQWNILWDGLYFLKHVSACIAYGWLCWCVCVCGREGGYLALGGVAEFDVTHYGVSHHSEHKAASSYQHIHTAIQQQLFSGRMWWRTLT